MKFPSRSGSAFTLLMTASACFAQGPLVLTTASGTKGADAFVQFGAGTTNYGGASDLTIKYGGNDTAGTNRKAYVRFDLSELNFPISDASLTLAVGINNGGSTNTTPQNFTLNLYGLNDGTTAGADVLGEDWDESTITWNNGPANIVAGEGAGNSVKTGTGTADGGEAVLIGSFSVTSEQTTGSIVIAASGPDLVNFLSADTDGQVTFIITRTGWTSNGGTPNPSQGGSNLTFRSKENTTNHQAPTLTLTPGTEDGVPILSFVYPSENLGALITWKAIIGRSYRIETSTDLLNWSFEVVDNWPGGGGATEGTLSYEDLDFAGTTEKRYYRILLE